MQHEGLLFVEFDRVLERSRFEIDVYLVRDELGLRPRRNRKEEERGKEEEGRWRRPLLLFEFIRKLTQSAIVGTAGTAGRRC